MYPEGSDAQRFVDEIDGEFEVEHYHGYAWYEGPGVPVDNDRELVDVIRLTTMPVKWDTFGMGYIVYPVRGAKEIDA